jgi:phosphoenolpyruvate carboxylase
VRHPFESTVRSGNVSERKSDISLDIPLPDGLSSWRFERLMESDDLSDTASPLSHTEVTRLLRLSLPVVEIDGAKPNWDSAESTDDPTTEDVRLLGALLGVVIREHAGDAFYRRIEQLRQVAKLARQEPGGPNWKKLGEIIDQALAGKAPSDALRWLSDSSAAFHILLALCKIAEAVHPPREQRTMTRTLATLTRRLSRDQLREACATQVRLVATAHPTKLLRHRVLAHQAEVFVILQQLRSRELTRRSHQVSLLNALTEKIEVLWATQFNRGEKPSAAEDIAHTLAFFNRTMYDSLARFHQTLTRAYRLHTGERLPEETRPRITLGSWVGADAVTDPNVSRETLADALTRQHHAVLQNYADDLLAIAPSFSHAGYRAPLKEDFAKSIDNDLEEMVSAGMDIKELMLQRSREPYRLKLVLIAKRLLTTIKRPLLDVGTNRPPFTYRRPSELIADLMSLRTSLSQAGYTRTLEQSLDLVITKVTLYRFHGFSVDVREKSEVVMAAALAVLEEARVSSTGLDPEELERLLTAHIQKNDALLIAPLFSDFDPLPPGFDQAALRRIFGLLNLARQAQRALGKTAVQNVVLSSCYSSREVLAALLVLKAQGLFHLLPDGAATSDVDIVPLFETIADLNTSPELLERLFTNSAYRKQLQARSNRQTVMLGHSDSGKDGGYFASNWAIYSAQIRMLEVANQHGIQLSFFHGRGGSIGRGGGPTHRAIMALPPGSTRHGPSVTEQGEVLAKYYTVASDADAHFCNVLGTLWEKRFSDPPEVHSTWRQAAEIMSASSRTAYLALVSDPDFMRYFEQVTPKEVDISHVNHARPQAKNGTSDATNDIPALRVPAVPWVFRWVQSRQMVPAWYGLGASLEAFLAQQGEHGLSLLREMFEQWPFFQSLVSNSEIALRHTDLNIAHYYIDVLAEPKAAAERILATLREEYARTVKYLAIVTGRDLLNGPDDHALAQSIALKEPYLDPLNYIQVRLLKDYRAQVSNHAPVESLDGYERAILASAEGLATGLGTTG